LQAKEEDVSRKNLLGEEGDSLASVPLWGRWIGITTGTKIGIAIHFTTVTLPIL